MRSFVISTTKKPFSVWPVLMTSSALFAFWLPLPYAGAGVAVKISDNVVRLHRAVEGGRVVGDPPVSIEAASSADTTVAESTNAMQARVAGGLNAKAIKSAALAKRERAAMKLNFFMLVNFPFGTKR